MLDHLIRVLRVHGNVSVRSLSGLCSLIFTFEHGRAITIQTVPYRFENWNIDASGLHFLFLSFFSSSDETKGRRLAGEASLTMRKVLVLDKGTPFSRGETDF